MSIVTILLSLTVVFLILALIMERARERRSTALAAEERRLRVELEAKQAALDRSATEERRLRIEIEAKQNDLEAKQAAIEKSATDMRASQLRLLQAEKVASLSGLVAGITHELNNPLAVISGFAELLRPRAPDDMTREALEAIHVEARRCSRIVQNLLSFSRQRRVTKAPVDMNEICSHVLELLRFKMALDDIQVESRLDKKAAPALGDLGQLQQVVLQLLLNAQRAVLEQPVGSGRRIDVETADEGEMLLVRVSDSGKGFTDADAARVFDPFFNAGSHGREGGLGLAVCYGLVTEHGGTITLETAPGKGSRIAVRLPTARDTPAVTSPSPRSPTPPAAPAGAAGAAARQAAADAIATSLDGQPGVLIVDDEEPMRRLLTQIFTREGYRCGAAKDGAEGLTLLRSGAYDVAIVDVIMPGMTGIEVFKRIRAESPALAAKIIFSTGDAGGNDTQAFFAEVPNRRLRKPYDISDVTRVVAEVVAEQRGGGPPAAGPATERGSGA